MAHGQNAARHGRPGLEYVSRRPYSYSGYGRITKVLTHRAERAQAKTSLRNDPDAG